MKFYKNIKRFYSIAKRFFPQWQLYGFSVAFWSLLFPFHHIFSFLKPFLGVQKHRAILIYLNNRYTSIHEKYSNGIFEPGTSISPDSNIWICWWDGEDTMPDLVKSCYNSIKQHAGSHPVKFISKFNYKEYVTFPDYIIEKVNAKIITITHFSNLLRVNLLYEYGGIWMDATILTLKDISLNTMSFFTLKAPAKKNNGVSMACFAGISDTKTSYSFNKKDPKISRWSGFLLAGIKGSCIFEYLREILYSYWKDHNDQIDYVLFDYTIALGYDNIPCMKEMIDSVPCSIMEKFVLEKNLNIEYSEKNITQYLQVPFHKLTWKEHFHEYTKDNRRTIYGNLLQSCQL